MRRSARDQPGAAADALGRTVLGRGGGHLPQSQERHSAADVRGAAAARSQLQFHRLLALPRGRERPGVRVLHPHRGGGRVGDRAGDSGGAVPRAPQHRPRRPQHAQGLNVHPLNPAVLIAIALLPLLVLRQVYWDGAPLYDAPVYTWLVSDGMHMEVGFLIDRLTALMMAVVTFVSLCVHVY